MLLAEFANKATDTLKLKAMQDLQEAKRMMLKDDYISARDKLQNLRQLFPTMKNIEPMLIVCDILSAASIRLPGSGIDYYFVLQLSTSSPSSIISYRYRKLVNALLETEFPGTDLALIILEDAFSVLSDHERRSEYDLKRNASMERYESSNIPVSSYHNLSSKETTTAAQSLSSYKGDFSSQIYRFDSGENKSKVTRTPEPKNIKVLDMVKYKRNVNFEETGDFSTDLDLLKKRSKDINMSFDNVNPLQTAATAHKVQCQDYYNFDNDRKHASFEVGQIWAAHYQRSMSHGHRYARVGFKSKEAVFVTWLKPIPVSSGERLWCDAGMPVACGSFDLDLEMVDEICSPTLFSHICSWDRGVAGDQFEIYPKKGEIWALYDNWNLDEWAYNPGFLRGCKSQLVEIVSDFSKYRGLCGAFLTKVDGFMTIFEKKTIGGNPITVDIPLGNLYMFSHKVPSYRFVGGEIDKAVYGMFELDQLALPRYMTNDIGIGNTAQTWNRRSSLTSITPERQISTSASYPEDCFLKPRWSPKDFSKDQVWTVYCGKDLMPRQYVRIDNNVLSESHVCVTFLEPLPVLNVEIEWKKANLPIVCGVFKVSETSTNLPMSKFCYLVRFQKSTDETLYKIVPRKGEVWAMYKKWDAKWKQSNYKAYQFQIVQILSDFSEEGSLMIVRLVEVGEFLTFFHKHQYDGFDLTHAVSKDEALSFSHRIPAFRVPGIEKHGIPENSWHLEPNALPPTGGD